MLVATQFTFSDNLHVSDSANIEWNKDNQAFQFSKRDITMRIQNNHNEYITGRS
jgi:hypothetical protein